MITLDLSKFRKFVNILFLGVIAWIGVLLFLAGIIRNIFVEYGVYQIITSVVPGSPLLLVYITDSFIYFICGGLLGIIARSKSYGLAVVTWAVEVAFHGFYVGIYLNWRAPEADWITPMLLNIVISLFFLLGWYSGRRAVTSWNSGDGNSGDTMS